MPGHGAATARFIVNGVASDDVAGDASKPAACRPLQLPPEAASAGEARHYVRDCLAALGRPDLIECAVLGVAELVANVCLHARTPLVVSIHASANGDIRIEVTDLSPSAPVRREADEDALGGRGLTLLDACGLWGVAPTTNSGSGKTIWFEPFSSLGD